MRPHGHRERNKIVSNDLDLAYPYGGGIGPYGITVGGQGNVVAENRVRAGVSGISVGGAYNTVRGIRLRRRTLQSKRAVALA
jgi:hypothetical protein